MQSKATTVEQYLAELPADRREALQAVRKVILKNLDKNIEEGMQYGMIGYYIPHRIFPAGYHCDPRQPLCYAGLASQKNYMSLYLMCIYLGAEREKWFHDAWAKSGKKLDMGKSCIRFKKLEDLPLDVIGEAFRRLPADVYIKLYEEALRTPARSARAAKNVSPKKSPSRTAKPKKSTKRAKSTKTARK